MMRNKPLLIVIFIVLALFVFVFLRNSGLSVRGDVDDNAPVVDDKVEDITGNDSDSIDSDAVVEKVKSIAVEGLEVSSVNDIKVISVEAMEWSDSCLGAATEDAICSQVITPGYRIVVGADGRADVTYHTNNTANSIIRK